MTRRPRARCCRRQPCASARTRCWRAGLRGELAHFTRRPRKPQYGGARRLRADPRQLSRPEGAVSRALAPFCDRRARSVGRARRAGGMDVAGREGARRVRSRDHLGAARCGRRAVVEVSRSRRPNSVITRSEGLAVASLRMFEAGAFSSDPADPLRADAERLTHLKHEEIADGFQSMVGNRLVGVEGRAELLASARQGRCGQPESLRARGSRAARRALRLSRRAS